MPRFLHPLAAQDLAEAFRFYRREGGRGLAARFLVEFDRVARLLELHPALGTPTESGRRTFPLRQFPHSIVYRPDDRGIRILVVRHQNRDPAHGDERR